MENKLENISKHDIEEFNKKYSAIVKNRIIESFKVYVLIGKLLDLYLKKQVESCSHLLSGSEDTAIGGGDSKNESK